MGIGLQFKQKEMWEKKKNNQKNQGNETRQQVTDNKNSQEGENR